MSRSNLVRKQYLVTVDNVQKIEKLASSKSTSAANIVRDAIDAYNPQDEKKDMESPDLMEIVSEKLKEAITATKKANRRVANTLKILDTKKV